MDPSVIVTVVSVIGTLIKTAPIVIKTAQDAKPFVMALIQALLGRAPTDEEITQLEEALTKLSAELQEPLPDAQPDDI